MQVARDVADQIARHVDELLHLKWDRRSERPLESIKPQEESKPPQATCSCGSGIPAETLQVAGQVVTLIALPLIFAQFHEEGKLPSNATKTELIETLRIYNPIPHQEEAAYAEAILQKYAAFCRGSH